MEDTIGAGGLSSSHWAQCCMPLRLGGLGIKDPLQIQAPAFLSSSIHYLSRGHSVGFHPTLPPSFLPLLLRFRDHVGPAFDPLPRWLMPPVPPSSTESLALPLTPIDSCHSSQRWWSSAFYSVLPDRISSSLPARDKLRLQLQHSPHSTSWMDVVPGSGPIVCFPAREYHTLLRWWLGLPLFSGDSAQLCPFCSDTLDPYGDHLVSCRFNKLTERHNDVRKALAMVLQSLGISCNFVE